MGKSRHKRVSNEARGSGNQDAFLLFVLARNRWQSKSNSLEERCHQQPKIAEAGLPVDARLPQEIKALRERRGPRSRKKIDKPKIFRKNQTRA